MRRPCLFCRIVAGERPASLVHADEVAVVFLDLRPVRPGHALVVPRRHAVHLRELSEDERAHLFRLAFDVSEAQRRAGLPADGAHVLVNDGPAASQSIPHVHVHVVPRGGGDGALALASFLGRRLPLVGPAAGRDELDGVARRLAEALRPAP